MTYNSSPAHLPPYLPAATAEQLVRAQLQRDQMQAKLSAHLAAQGTPDALPIPTRRANTNTLLLTPEDHLKALGLHRKSVKAEAVRTHYQPQTTRAPLVFPYTPESRLSALVRPVGPAWVQLLTSISTTSISGGRLLGSQGRNVVKIIEELRKRCFLRVSESGRPVQVREQVVLQVEGEKGNLAAACGLSPSTFYRALQHPLAHAFLRTQKVQRETEAGDRQNVATLFSVSMYEPLIPAVLEDALYAESVEELGVFVVPVLNCQSDGTKERPVNTQLQENPVDNLKRLTRGLSESAQIELQKILDSAPLATKRPADLENSSSKDFGGAAATGAALALIEAARPDLYAFAAEIARHHDKPDTRAVATQGYYKALLHLGAGVVTGEVRRLARWQKQGQQHTSPGAVLTSLLNKKARALTGFNLRDLGSVKGSVLS